MSSVIGLLAWLLLGPEASASGVACGGQWHTAAQIERAALSAMTAATILPVEEYLLLQRELARKVGCTSELLPGTTASLVHQAGAVARSLDEDVVGSLLRLQAARHADPRAVVPSAIAAAIPSFVDDFKRAEKYPGIAPENVEPPPKYTLFVDGGRGSARPMNLPAILQYVDENDVVVWGRVVEANQPMPEGYPRVVEVQMHPAEALGRHLGQNFVVSLGAGGILAPNAYTIRSTLVMDERALVLAEPAVEGDATLVASCGEQTYEFSFCKRPGDSFNSRATLAPLAHASLGFMGRFVDGTAGLSLSTWRVEEELEAWEVWSDHADPEARALLASGRSPTLHPNNRSVVLHGTLALRVGLLERGDGRSGIAPFIGAMGRYGPSGELRERDPLQCGDDQVTFEVAGNGYCFKDGLGVTTLGIVDLAGIAGVMPAITKSGTMRLVVQASVGPATDPINGSSELSYWPLGERNTFPAKVPSSSLPPTMALSAAIRAQPFKQLLRPPSADWSPPSSREHKGKKDE